MTKIIQFPVARPVAGNPDPGNARQPSPPTRTEDAPPRHLAGALGSYDAPPLGRATAPPDLSKLSEDQQEAIALVLSGASFVFIALKPTTSGADFYTALHGDHDELRNAEQELPAVIGRLYARKGVR